eukprot:1947298-Rhodomonas_salina.1
MVGVTPVWTKIVGMETPKLREEWGDRVGITDNEEQPAIDPTTTITETLRGYLHETLQRYWSGEKLKLFNMQLAGAIQSLVANGYTRTVQLQTGVEGTWRISECGMPRTATATLLQALEESVPGSKREAVAHRNRGHQERTGNWAELDEEEEESAGSNAWEAYDSNKSIRDEEAEHFFELDLMGRDWDKHKVMPPSPTNQTIRPSRGLIDW